MADKNKQTQSAKNAVANKIKQARLSRGWSQIETALLLGVHLTTYQLWERGAGKPSRKNRMKLEKILGIKLDE